MNHRLTHRCGEEHNDYRRDKLGIFTGKINPHFTTEKNVGSPLVKGWR